MDSLFKWMLPPRPLVITLSTAKDFLSSKITRTAEDYFRAELMSFQNCSKSFDTFVDTGVEITTTIPISCDEIAIIFQGNLERNLSRLFSKTLDA